MWTALLHGFLVQMGLIMAIGPQNSFVLTQGLRRGHIGLICLICTLSDVILIALGVGGMAALLQATPAVGLALRYGGAAFLLWYGYGRLRSALRPTQGMQTTPEKTLSRTAAALATLAFTWLNPHVYLDTVVMIGVLAGGFPGHQPAFGLGAATASGLYFFSLGYGARLLAPTLSGPAAWRILDMVVAIMMAGLAAGLIFTG